MERTNLELMEGQAGRLTFNFIAPDGLERKPKGAVRVGRVDYPMTPEPGNPEVLYIGAMKQGSYLYEVRNGGATVIYGHIVVKPSPLGDVPAVKDWQVDYNASQTIASVTVTLTPGPRGPKGDPGEGEKGDKGDPGPSAYEAAQARGYAGTEAEWLGGLTDITEAKEAAEQAATTADACKAAARASAEAASTKATEAEGAMREAAASASAAAGFMAEAKVSAKNAQTSAVSSAASASAASESKTAAANSEQQAATHAANAGASETAASNSATASASSATSAAQSAASATSSASSAEQSTSAASQSATAASSSASASAASASQAAASAQTASTHRFAAEQAATQASTSQTAAAQSASSAAADKQSATQSAAEAAGQAQSAAEAAGQAQSAAEAAIAAATAAGADQAAIAAGKAAEAALHAAEARRVKEEMKEEQASVLTHVADTTTHMTPTQAANLDRLSQMFPAVDPDTPSTPEPTMPDEAISHAQIRAYFSTNAQPGVSEAPSAVYVSRVPWARKDPESGAWVNNAPKVTEEVFGVTRKFMDNAGLLHTPSTDTVENPDDYNGKLWAFFWQHGNYIVDEFGVKHLTAIKGQVVDGKVFDPEKPTCAFGTKFYFFVVLERWQDPETGEWTTDDGTETGTPLFQLYGISTRAWNDLDQSRRDELAAHGVTESDFALWPECEQWDSVDETMVPRPYWIHSAYCGGFEEDETGAARLVSKRNTPLYNNLSHNTLNALYGNRANFGGSACVQAFGLIFDVVKNATKHSQSIHAGNASNNNSAVKASLSTASADYLFPIASQGNFRVGCSVWLWQTAGGSAGGTTYRRSLTVQIGRINAIETRTLTLADGSEASALCLVIDPETVQPFIARTGADNAAAIAATKALTDAGTYAACFATQGMALAGETDAVIGKHDGSRTSNTDSKHPYRVQGTEYLPGIWMTAADVVAIKGTGAIDVEIDGVVSIPTSSQYVILQAGPRAARRTSGSLQQFLDGGYIPVGIATTTAGYIVNMEVSKTGVAYPVAAAGTGSSDSTGHGDHLWTGASPAEFLCGGYLSSGANCGSAALTLVTALSHAGWYIGGRD